MLLRLKAMHIPLQDSEPWGASRLVHVGVALNAWTFHLGGVGAGVDSSRWVIGKGPTRRWQWPFPGGVGHSGPHA